MFVKRPNRIKVTDVAESMRWQWARTMDGQWTKKVANWNPRGQKRPRGRPFDSWNKDTEKPGENSPA